MVIGGASLLGSNLCERLLLEGDEVIAVDDFTSGSFATLAHLEGQPRFSFIEHDVRAQLAAQKLDAVFHLALPSSRRAYESDPVRSTVTSVVGTAHALELAADHDARLVLATSPERWGHGVRCAESLVVEFTRTRKLDVRIVRVASTYGPRMPADDPHVLMHFIRQVVRGEDLTIPDDTTHRLAYVDDAVDTLLRTLDADLRVPAVAAPCVEATTSEIAEAVLAATSVRAELRASSRRPAASAAQMPPSLPFSMRPTTPEALPASIVFGQAAALELREGVAHTVRWFEQRFSTFMNQPPRTSGIFGVMPIMEKKTG
jgi:UDP-glucuronate decarboxylase